MKVFAIIGIITCVGAVLMSIYIAVVLLRSPKKKKDDNSYDMWSGNKGRAEYFVRALQQLTLLSEADLTKLREEKREMSCEEFTSEYGMQLQEYYAQRWTMNDFLRDALTLAIKAKKIIDDKEGRYKKNEEGIKDDTTDSGGIFSA